MFNIVRLPLGLNGQEDLLSRGSPHSAEVELGVTSAPAAASSSQ